METLDEVNVGPRDDARFVRAGRLFPLTPRMLLARASEQAAVGRRALPQRRQAHEHGQWQSLLGGTRYPASATWRTDPQECAKVRKGELSQARHLLTAAELALGNAASVATLILRRGNSSRPPSDPVNRRAAAAQSFQDPEALPRAA